MIFDLKPVHTLPDGWTPLEAVAIVKCLDEEGGVAHAIRSTEGLSGMECVGMLTVAKRQQLDMMSAMFEDEDGEDEE